MIGVRENKCSSSVVFNQIPLYVKGHTDTPFTIRQWWWWLWVSHRLNENIILRQIPESNIKQDMPPKSKRSVVSLMSGHVRCHDVSCNKRSTLENSTKRRGNVLSIVEQGVLSIVEW